MQEKKWCIQTTLLTVILTFLNDTDMYASFFQIVVTQHTLVPD